MTTETPNADTDVEAATESDVDMTTIDGRLKVSDMDIQEVLETYRLVDASAGNVLSGVWGHEGFCRAVQEFIGREVADQGRLFVMATAFYDFEKSIGGDGMSCGAVSKLRCNTVRSGADEEVAVTKLTLRDEEEVGRFMALTDELEWAVEWGFDRSPRSGMWSVVVSPSDKLDY